MRSAMAGSSARALQCSRSVQNAAQAHDLIQNPLRHFAFAHFRKREVAAVAGEERDDIRVAIESRAFGGDVVGYDEVGILHGKFFSRVLRDMVRLDRKSTRLNSSHLVISYAVFCLKKKKINKTTLYTYNKHLTKNTSL